MPVLVGLVTLVAGGVLFAAPARATGPLGLEGQEAALRAVGLSDLVLVPGLLRGRPRWPWMVARGALNLAQAAYLGGIAPKSSSPGALKGGSALLACLTLVDAGTGLVLRRTGS